ncbi:MAG: hypothetical protein Q9N32_05505 [Gammaproteobacteria bacterium]|nr:hypothetical protein [Gammaproteobacteria bacterium]
MAYAHPTPEVDRSCMVREMVINTHGELESYQFHQSSNEIQKHGSPIPM